VVCARTGMQAAAARGCGGVAGVRTARRTNARLRHATRHAMSCASHQRRCVVTVTCVVSVTFTCACMSTHVCGCMHRCARIVHARIAAAAAAAARGAFRRPPHCCPRCSEGRHGRCGEPLTSLLPPPNRACALSWRLLTAGRTRCLWGQVHRTARQVISVSVAERSEPPPRGPRHPLRRNAAHSSPALLLPRGAACAAACAQLGAAQHDVQQLWGVVDAIGACAGSNRGCGGCSYSMQLDNAPHACTTALYARHSSPPTL
jgi:hypothetical protein